MNSISDRFITFSFFTSLINLKEEGVEQGCHTKIALWYAFWKKNLPRVEQSCYEHDTFTSINKLWKLKICVQYIKFQIYFSFRRNADHMCKTPVVEKRLSVVSFASNWNRTFFFEIFSIFHDRCILPPWSFSLIWGHLPLILSPFST